MSSLIKSLALLIAIVGLAVASNASLVSGESREHIPGSLSELGDFDSLDWVKVVRSECKTRYCEPDKAFELLKTLDKIYGPLDDDAKINRNERKIVEQFQINQIDGDQFCAEGNLEQLAGLSHCYHRKFPQKYFHVGNYLHERGDHFAFVCRSHVLKNLNKRVDDLDKTVRHDIEQTLGNKLVLLSNSSEILQESFTRPKMFSTGWKSIEKINPKWQAILLEFLKEKSGNGLDAKYYITKGDEGREEFNQLFYNSVLDTCSRWIYATKEAETFQERDRRQEEDYTEEQASWMKYTNVCSDITFHRNLLVRSLYNEFMGKSSKNRG